MTAPTQERAYAESDAKFRTCDVIVVGSGASGVSVATPLVDAGLDVRMLDYGNRDEAYAELIPERPFADIRRSDPEQRRYFLGHDFEGISFGKIAAGAQLTPPRQHVVRDTDSATPVLSEFLPPVESLAIGGLGAAWGAGCPPFTTPDLGGFPITHADLVPGYEAVAARIGISGDRDDLMPFFGDLKALQPPLDMDSNARAILATYERKRAQAHRRGFHLGRPRLAMLSRDLPGRSATAYRDMDFWSDAGRSVYRPQWTVDDLRQHTNFTYRNGLLVESFTELPDGTVEVRARRRDGGPGEVHRARAVVLAAGALGSARIALRSLDRYDHPVPFLCNPHTYAPMVNVNALGKLPDTHRHSMAQLCFVYTPGGSQEKAVVGHVFTYRSLLGFKLVRESPLAHLESMDAIRLLTPSFAIAVIEHADEPTDAKHCMLRRATDGGRDALEIRYTLSADEEAEFEKDERAVVRSFFDLGCICIKRVRLGYAASIHQAGTLPMTTAERELTTTRDGLLRGTRSVYVADGSVLPRLPSKGLTFTLMANAHRVGTLLGSALRV